MWDVSQRCAALRRCRMDEPHRTRFVELLRRGVATRDIQDSSGASPFDSEATMPCSDAFLVRELERVEMHSRGLCPLLVAHVGTASRILDVGCSTGGTTIALALSGLNPMLIVGVDANEAVLE